MSNALEFKTLINPRIWDSWNRTSSPSTNLKLFFGIYLKVDVFLTSTNTAVAPLVWPTISSPTTISPVVVVGPFIWVRDISGEPKSASDVDATAVS